MGVDVGSVGGASGATEVDNVNPGGIGDGDSLGGTAVDNVDGSGMSATCDESTDQLLYGSVVSSTPSEFQVQSDLDGHIVTVEQKVVVKAIASDGNFEDGTPVSYQTSSDGSKILSLMQRSNTENLKTTG